MENHPISDSNLNLAWGCVASEALSRLGIRDAVICPGTRSAPWALGLGTHPKIRATSVLDERTAAFFALGLARATQRPVALLCTSGTAAANFLPAVIEASLSEVPLLILTADRPPEARDCGAGQAIDQLHLYGRQVRWFHEMAIPSDQGFPYLIRCLDLATRWASGSSGRSIPGPVHLNLPLREPLIPAPGETYSLPIDLEPHLHRLQPITGGPSESAHGNGDRRLYPLDASQQAILADFAQELTGPDFGVILAGEPLGSPNYQPESEAAGVAALAEASQLPIWADVLHPIRHRPDSATVSAHYELALRQTTFPTLGFAVVVGRLPTCKTLRERLTRDQTRLLVLNPSPQGLNPTSAPASTLHLSPAALAEALAALPSARHGSRNGNPRASTVDANAPRLTVLRQESPVSRRRSYQQPEVAFSGSTLAAAETATDYGARPNSVGLSILAEPRQRHWRETVAAEYEASAATILQAAWTAETSLSEMAVMPIVAMILPPQSTVMIASSTPIRDAEWFWPVTQRGYRVVANRGANGIDGTLGTACGWTAGASGASTRGSPAGPFIAANSDHHLPFPSPLEAACPPSTGRTFLVTGDLALLHDQNAFLLHRELAACHGASLTIVLIDNDGGGIFNNLPVARLGDPFERFFGTPQGVDWAALAAAHDITYQVITTAEELTTAVTAPPPPGLQLLHLRTDRTLTATHRKAILNHQL